MLILVENTDLVEALRGSEKSTAEKNAKTSALQCNSISGMCIAEYRGEC